MNTNTISTVQYFVQYEKVTINAATTLESPPRPMLYQVGNVESNFTITLADPTTAAAFPLVFQKKGTTSNNITLSGTINGAASYVLTGENKAITLIANGVDYSIVSLYTP